MRLLLKDGLGKTRKSGAGSVTKPPASPARGKQEREGAGWEGCGLGRRRALRLALGCGDGDDWPLRAERGEKGSGR